jgi:drug/metabolite transporter (DMT)-like permease
LGDLFQQYAAKYIGIGRGIPLSNTNQLWGLAWGALVFGELSGKGWAVQGLIAAGSVTMVAGAAAISLAEAPAGEQESWRASQRRESERYQLDPDPTEAAAPAADPRAKQRANRRWWDVPIVVVAAGVFLLLARGVRRPPIAMNLLWMALLAVGMLGFLVAGGMVLWKRTRFS